jgi:hypothetical protein
MAEFSLTERNKLWNYFYVMVENRVEVTSISSIYGMSSYGKYIFNITLEFCKKRPYNTFKIRFSSGGMYFSIL